MYLFYFADFSQFSFYYESDNICQVNNNLVKMNQTFNHFDNNNINISLDLQQIYRFIMIIHYGNLDDLSLQLFIISNGWYIIQKREGVQLLYKTPLYIIMIMILFLPQRKKTLYCKLYWYPNKLSHSLCYFYSMLIDWFKLTESKLFNQNLIYLKIRICCSSW